MSELTRRIEQIILLRPDDVVFEDPAAGSAFTFRQFGETARKIAAELVAAGVGKGDFVTVELPRGKEFIAALYAVWLIGAAYVPLSPTYPEERLSFIRCDCGAKAAVNEKLLRGAANRSPLEGTADAEDDAPALVIYTSGSTGKPKGVLHSHRSVSDAVLRFNEYFRLPEGSRTALAAPFTFVVSVHDIFLPLSEGLTGVIMPSETMRDPVLLADFIQAHQINHLFISPKMLRVFTPKGHSLRSVYTGSERVSDTFSDEFELTVMYGQSESAGALAFRVDRAYDNTPIGKPIGSERAYILDDEGNPAKEGELCLAGCFASEYLHLPEQSAKTFVSNPFAEQDGFPRMLRTGDIVRELTDGNILFLNRRDWMVKINGQRVEPGEIETVIKETDGILDAAVKDFKNQFGQVYLAAYYVEKEPLDPEQLRRGMARRLPPYMIPAFFTRLEQLPVNANGKLDRGALPAPEAGRFKTDFAPPETDMQRALCRAFEAVLSVEHIGIDDDFFALGGDSIKCAMVAAECSLYKISTGDIFSGRTPRMIERLLIQRASRSAIVKKTSRPRMYPLTPFERGMYLEQKLDENSTVYNLNVAAIIGGADAEKVRAALNEVFRAHEAFHSFYSEQNGLPVRVLTDRLPEIEEKTADSRDEVIRLIDSYAVPFHLDSGIPVRPVLYTLPDDTVILHMAVHHIAFDGGSAKTFLRELADALQGKAVNPPELDLSDLYDVDNEEKRTEGLEFYRQQFSDGVPVCDMPLRGKRPKLHPLSDRIASRTLGEEKLREIDNAARFYGVTEFELIFAAVAMTLGKYTCSEDVVLGIPTNMRPAGCDDMIGMFVNTAPVRVKPVRNQPLKEFVKAASQAVRGATYGASLPFEDVVAEFVRQRDESRNPMFDVSLNYMWFPPAVRENGVSVELYVPLQRMGRDVGIVIRRSGDSMRLMLQYASELFDSTVMDNFAHQITHTLSLLTDLNAATVRDALTMPRKQMKALTAYSAAGESGQEFSLLHRMFEHAASLSPDKTALIACDETLTFRELDERANMVAHHLIERGIRVGDSVALLLPRRAYFFACLFGVNKAGAAFIPCDPQYPPDRINHIISDSDASFIITTADKLCDYPPEKAIDVAELLDGSSRQAPDVPMSGDELAYMIYTSGSTGKPKGVMLRHCGICNYLTDHPVNTVIHNIVNRIHTYISVTTVSFDMSFKEHTAALCNGKTLIFAAEDEMNDPRALAELMEKHGADCINATPSRFAQYMEYAPFRAALAKCRLILCGGEAYPLSLRDSIRACATDALILNTYGPTEITVSSNAAVLNHAESISIGRPLLNYIEYIVDKFGDLAPFGVTGELYIGGIGVAKGYKNLPEKTAAAFIEYRGIRMYRSGDYAKWDKEGNVIILGRLDNQVKLRGLRIELGEIEGLMAAQPGMKKVAVVIRKLNGQDNLCAYFTADHQVDVDALREELKKHLTHYMVPTAYLQMNELPMTANGKTDVRHLPDPVPVSLREYVAPANETEEFFCESFRKALHADRVGATDSFFEIGGTSLIVTSVVLDATEHGFAITYGDVFRHPTPRALAQLFGKEEIQENAALFDFAGYDYSAINRLLKSNTVDSFRKGTMRPLGNVLITGSTGYMGAHLLAQYLTEESGTAFCMLRKGSFDSVADRLRNMMYYYFDDRFEKELNTRVKVFEGDVTDYRCFAPLENEPVDTVFNCAANVKHFSSGTDIEDINVGGVTNCVRLCEKRGARLIHFSTISVAGTAEDMNALSGHSLDEQTLYFGQTLDNQYTSSKLMGERVALEAAAERGLDVKVIRVGTLAARESDGEFQINFLTNNFMGRLRSYNLLGCFPYGMIENQVCMGPIDTSCRAFLLLARTPRECCLFNAVNNHTLPLGDIIRRMNLQGMHIRFVDSEEFAAALAEAQKEPEKAAILSSMTAYMNIGHGRDVAVLPAESHYTTQILARMGFFWNASNEKYVDDFISMLQGFRFFASDKLNR